MNEVVDFFFDVDDWEGCILVICCLKCCIVLKDVIGFCFMFFKLKLLFRLILWMGLKGINEKEVIEILELIFFFVVFKVFFVFKDFGFG